MEVTSTSTLQKQSSSLMVSCLLPPGELGEKGFLPGTSSSCRAHPIWQ